MRSYGIETVSYTHLDVYKRQTLDKTIADNTEGNTCLPELESYTDDTMQFFYGWYTQKDDNFNGIHTRFTRNTKLTEKQHDLYAKWGSGIFSIDVYKRQDKLCVHQKAIERTNETIVCLPHKVVVEIQDAKEADFDSMT